jgi:SAM-dependent methyltransferase
LDVGCGKGGDIGKFYHAEIANAVCIDVDYNGIHNAFDGAISRYNKATKQNPAYPKMTFLCADFTVPLIAEEQYAVVSDKTIQNKNLLERFFPKKGVDKFDRMNIQFVFHYFLVNDQSWMNACDNINRCLKEGGYMLITTFDAQKVIEALGENDKYTLYYNTNGEKKVLFEIVKKFSIAKKEKNKEVKSVIGTGNAIDVYNGWIAEEYYTEYLVDKDFITRELKTRCNMELVDTEMFDTLYEIQRENITQVLSKYDNNLQTRQFMKDISIYYDNNDETNKTCFNITKLNRYYIFRKSERK